MRWYRVGLLRISKERPLRKAGPWNGARARSQGKLSTHLSHEWPIPKVRHPEPALLESPATKTSRRSLWRTAPPSPLPNFSCGDESALPTDLHHAEFALRLPPTQLPRW